MCWVRPEELRHILCHNPFLWRSRPFHVERRLTPLVHSTWKGGVSVWIHALSTKKSTLSMKKDRLFHRETMLFP